MNLVWLMRTGHTCQAGFLSLSLTYFRFKHANTHSRSFLSFLSHTHTHTLAFFSLFFIFLTHTLSDWIRHTHTKSISLFISPFHTQTHTYIHTLPLSLSLFDANTHAHTLSLSFCLFSNLKREKREEMIKPQKTKLLWGCNWLHDLNSPYFSTIIVKYLTKERRTQQFYIKWR